MSKTITRKYIQRITKREGNTNIRQSSGGGGGGGGASQYWVEENYISKLFFNQLFTVYDEDGNVVEPNDTESVIASIKSMFGFWTDAYLSALGNGEGGGAELTLASLADVDVHGVANGQALVYDAYTQKWVPGQAGLDPTSLWQELGSLGTEQISSTHLTTALSTYNPTNNFKTINGYSIIGTGDINVGGGGGAYLPLSGGTLTGMLSFNKSSGYAIAFPQYYIGFNTNTDFFFYTEENISFAIWTNGQKRLKIGGDGNIGINIENPTCALDISGYTLASWYSFRRNDNAALGFIGNGDSTDNISIANYTTGAIDFVMGSSFYKAMRITSSGYVGIGNTSPAYKLDVNGDIHLTNSLRFNYGEYLDEYGCIHQINSNDTWIIFSHSNRINLAVASGSGHVGIGTSSPSYALHVAGVAYASTGFYSGGYVTALSDARHKDVKGDVGLTVGEVANAPAVKFLWKDRRQEGLQVGSIAQYWQKVMPEAIVKNADGELTMSYGVIALLASIATARKVEDHERRIRELEEENKKLKQQLNAA